MTRIAFYDTKPYDRQYFGIKTSSEDFHWEFHEFRLTRETVGSVAGAEVVCVFVNDRLDVECLEKLKEQGVRLIALRCAGFNNVDVEVARKLSMAIVRVPAYSPHAVAEHTVALLLTLNRKTHRAFNRVREHNFSLSGLVGVDLFGKTVGVIGTGRIGRIAAQIFKGFETKVLAYDPFPSTAWANERGICYTDFESVLTQSDILTLHIPLTPETHHLLDSITLPKLKKGAFLINTSRGKLIETSALLQQLKSGHLGGVALDVYEEEEGIFFEDHSSNVLQDDQLNLLLSFPNVLITSHQAFLTDEALAEIARVTLENIRRLTDGSPYLEGTML